MQTMSKTLYLPDHVAEKVNKERQDANADSPSVENAFVESGKRELDPSLLDKSLLERLPQPTGWRLLVMPYQGSSKTAGGLFGPEGQPWCKQGQWVCIGRYSGSRFKIDGGEVRIINDDEVIATILEPTDVKHV